MSYSAFSPSRQFDLNLQLLGIKKFECPYCNHDKPVFEDPDWFMH
jgi:hypothetical protein